MARWSPGTAALLGIASAACTQDFDALMVASSAAATASGTSSTAASGGETGSGATASGAGGPGGGGVGDGGAGGRGASTATTGGAGGGGGEPPLAVVPCASETCAPGEVCCFDNTTDTQVGCAPATTCGGGLIEVACDGPEDCETKICCAHHNGAYQSVACAASCSGSDYNVMCGGGNDSACPPMQSCWSSDELLGYSYCE